jgi:hypothetical protein
VAADRFLQVEDGWARKKKLYGCSAYAMSSKTVRKCLTLSLLLFLYFRLNEKLRAVSNFDFVNKYFIMVSTERENNYPKP